MDDLLLGYLKSEGVPSYLTEVKIDPAALAFRGLEFNRLVRPAGWLAGACALDALHYIISSSLEPTRLMRRVVLSVSSSASTRSLLPASMPGASSALRAGARRLLCV